MSYNLHLPRKTMTTRRWRIGPYDILESLGQGGMGVVYRGRHVETGESAAIKTVRVPYEWMVTGIRREIQALARLRHPGVVQIIAEGVQDGLPWYAMDLLKGVSLRDYLHPGSRESRSVPQNLRHVLTLIRRLCSALAFLHGEGIVHGDLKPDNIMIRPDGMPVLMDFGLISQFGGEVSREALESGPPAVGTLPYMAPERIRGELVDARADLYSLGCILRNGTIAFY